MSESQSLRRQCLTAFENYAREARKTCELLGAVEFSAPSAQQLLAVLWQAQIESEVKEVYFAMRRRLCEALANGVEIEGPPLEASFPEIDMDQWARKN